MQWDSHNTYFSPFSYFLFCIQHFFFFLCTIKRKDQTFISMYMIIPFSMCDNGLRGWSVHLNTLHLHAVTCISHMTTNADHRVICVIACPRLKERCVEGKCLEQMCEVTLHGLSWSKVVLHSCAYVLFLGSILLFLTFPREGKKNILFLFFTV